MEERFLPIGIQDKEDQFKNYAPDSKNMLPVVYQSGYLTRKRAFSITRKREILIEDKIDAVAMTEQWKSSVDSLTGGNI